MDKIEKLIQQYNLSEDWHFKQTSFREKERSGQSREFYTYTATSPCGQIHRIFQCTVIVDHRGAKVHWEEETSNL